MLNILKSLILIFFTTLIISACGEENTPATTAANTENRPVDTDTPVVESVPDVPVAEAPAPAAPVDDNQPEPVAMEDPLPDAPVAESTAPSTPPATAANTAPVDGGQIYNTYCAICHKAGMNAAPKFGSKPLWAKRIAQGREMVYANAINGLRGMPARGGFASLTDEEVKAGVDYMVRAAGGWQD